MLGVLWLALSFAAQSAAPINTGTAAQVAFLSSDGLVTIPAVPATPQNRTVRVLILSFSSSSLVMPGERAALRVKDAAPRFQVTLPAGVDADEVRLVRLKPKDGRRAVGHSSSFEHPFSKEDLVEIKLEPADPATPRIYRVVVPAPLKAGEYALLIDMRFFDFAID